MLPKSIVSLILALARWYTPAEVLKMATHDDAELLAMSGPRNLYPGKLDVVEEGALADPLLMDGDPIANIKILETLLKTSWSL
jgi:imidazolonepropionase-like amidohydrolase